MSKARYEVRTTEEGTFFIFDHLYDSWAREEGYLMTPLVFEKDAAAKALALNEAYDEMETCTTCYAEVRTVNKRWHDDWHIELGHSDEDRWND